MNENNSMAYAQNDDTQSESAQNYSVYSQSDNLQDNPVSTPSAGLQDRQLSAADTGSQDSPVSVASQLSAADTGLHNSAVSLPDIDAQSSMTPAPDNNLQANAEPTQGSPVSLQKDAAPSGPLPNTTVYTQNSGAQNPYPSSDASQNNYVQNDPVYTQGNPMGAMPYGNAPLLQLNDLCKRYPGMGTYMSVFHMNLIIPRGRIIGLLGPNGCGKTTLIKMINGLLAPTSGNVLINGMEPCPATKKVISYLPERTYLDNGMKVSQMVAYFADFYEDFSSEKAYGMLGALGISSDARLKTLSKGTKEKVQLILVMSRQADLYILDEPIAGVDPAARDYILRTIITNYNPGSTIILSTHLISDIENILDDVIFMKNGSLMLYTSVDSIRSQMGKSVDTYFREVYAC